MKNGKKVTRIIALVLLVGFLSQTVSCGYFMYPARRGQTGGRVDPAVAVMDGLCLLLFIIPGVVAFAVDFSSGAIYLPGTRASQDDGKTTVVMADPKDLNDAALEQIVQEQTGLSIHVKSATTKVLSTGSPDVGQVLNDLKDNGYSA